MADFSEVVRLEPNNVNAYFSRGSALDSLGHFEKAVEDYTKALVLDSSAVEAAQERTAPSAQTTADQQQLSQQAKGSEHLAAEASARASYYSPLVAGLATGGR